MHELPGLGPRSGGRQSVRRLRSEVPFSAALAVALFVAFYASPVRTSFDSRWVVHTAMSFARGHWGDLSEYTPILEREGLYAIEYHKGQPRTAFPIGASLLSVPAMGIVSLVRPSFNHELRYALPLELEGLLAAGFGSLIGVLFWWIALARFHSHYLALASTFILCFCTSIWSTATRALWQHTPVVLMLVVAMGLMLAARTRPSLIQYLGLPLAMGFICRPTVAVEILVFSVYVLVFYRRWFVRYISWPLLLAIPWITYNVIVYDFPIPPYYRPSDHDSGAVGEALLGNLFSPARGLLVYSPVLLFALPGFVLSLREIGTRWLHVSFAAVVVLHWLLVSRFGLPWWGGHSYGPRFMTDVLPFLVYFLVFVLIPRTAVGELGRVAIAGAVALLAGVSLLMHAQGALDQASYQWNADVNIDKTPVRLWSWRDPPFARGLIRSRLERLLNLTGGVVPADVALYESGMVVRFEGDAQIDPSVLGTGWSGREREGIWSDGPEARLILEFRPATLQTAGDLFLIVRAQAFVSPSHPRQSVDVLCNDVLVAHWTFEMGDGLLERRARVGAAVAAARLPLVVTFRFLNPAVPAELRMGDDKRLLGISLTSLRLAPAGERQ